MVKRQIYLVDSLLEDGLYFFLCVNVPEPLHLELMNLDPSSLTSYEKFFFANKEEIEMKYFVVDQVFAGFLYLFGAAFGENGRKDVDIMVDVLDKVFVSHSLDDNERIVSNHDQELLLQYLSDIEKELISHEEDIARSLVSRCHDLSSSILSSKTIRLPNRIASDNSVVSYVHNGVREIMQEWFVKENQYDFYIKTKLPFDLRKILDNIEIRDNAYELDYLTGIGEMITQLIRKLTYEYELLTNEELAEFKNLWLLLVSTQYRALLPSIYMKSVRKIVQR